ncbi:hypothetical protein N0V90_012426 [Kalmusia sp. IMI 367209]|nr:hypothetical protein N0V90_012426 [Kalmusia sp. IMI 367209]
MPYRCITFIHRKEGTTPQEFRDGWEAHMRLLIEVTKPHSPAECVRHYPARVESDIAQRAPTSLSRHDGNAPLVLLGNTELVTWDCMVDCTYRDELHFQQFYALVSETEVGDRIAASEYAISDPTKLKLVVIGETLVTREGGS